MAGMASAIGFLELRIERAINNTFEENCGILNFKRATKSSLIPKS